MKHFLVILYMALCVLEVKAQQKEPLIYGLYDGKLNEYNNSSGVHKEVCTIKGIIAKQSDGDLTAFDAYNGRYFFILPMRIKEFDSVYMEEVTKQFLQITEIDVSNGISKYYRLPISGFYINIADLHYDPFNNSLIYYYKGVLNSLNLNNGEIKKITDISPNVNYTNSKLTLYIPEIQAYIFGHREIEPDTLFEYYVYDFNKGTKQKLFSSKVMVKNFMYSSQFGLFGLTDPPHNILSISSSGEVKVLKAFPDNLHTAWGVNYAVSNKQHLLIPLLGSISGYLLDYNLYTADTLYRVPFSFGGIYSEFHTFNKPFILRNGDTLQTVYGKNYRWLWNGKPIENNANEQKHYPRQCGYYSVEVTFTDGRIDTSEAVYNNISDSKGQPITETFAAAYPNPFQEKITVHYKTCAEENTFIQIYDCEGRRIVSKKIEKLPAGEHNFDWQTDNDVRYGLYFIKVFSGSELISTQKVVKQ